MNIYEKEILEVLKFSLRDERYKITSDINLDIFKVEALEQGLLPVIYYYLDKENLDSLDGYECLDEIKKLVIILNYNQLNIASRMDKITEEIYKDGIEIIVLKGMQVRKYYKKPELRTMSDVDILVKEEDFPKVREYLISKGYEEGDYGHNIHRSFILKQGVPFEIEVHWNAINQDYFNYDKDAFEEKLWVNSISNGTYKELEVNELIIYLIMHMAVHARHTGFGIRQIYDIALINKIDADKIDWGSILEECHKYGIRKLAEGIIKILSIYFESKIPKRILEFITISEDDAYMLLEYSLESGVHGKKSENEDYEILSRYSYIIANKSIIRRVGRLLFPSKESILNDYKYLNKYSVAYPYACIHYQITKGLLKKYSLIENINNIKSSIKLGKKRQEIIKLLEL